MRRRFMVSSLEAFDTSNYLTMESLVDNFTVSFSGNVIEYAIDGHEWEVLEEGSYTRQIKTGHKVSFKANLTPVPLDGIGYFVIYGACNIEGNVMSMLFGDEAKDKTDLTGYEWAFYQLFVRCSSIQKVTKDFLPATTLASDCYNSMFESCTGLTQAPELPATTLASSCYNYMFYGCTGLTQAPSLPATVLVNSCYYSMFSGCTNLNYIKMLATGISARYCLVNWVNGVASTGTFVKNKDATWDVTGVDGVPSGWTVITDEEESGGG